MRTWYDLSKVVYRVSGRDGIRVQAIWLQNLCSCSLYFYVSDNYTNSNNNDNSNDVMFGEFTRVWVFDEVGILLPH